MHHSRINVMQLWPSKAMTSSGFVSVLHGSADVRQHSHLVVSQLARVEVPAALWRKHRMGEITASDAGVLVADFEADYFGDGTEPPRFSAIAVSANILDSVARLAGVHGLCAYDAVQLASALAAANALPERVAFLAFDSTLNTAAAAEGLVSAV